MVYACEFVLKLMFILSSRKGGLIFWIRVFVLVRGHLKDQLKINIFSSYFQKKTPSSCIFSSSSPSFLIACHPPQWIFVHSPSAFLVIWIATLNSYQIPPPLIIHLLPYVYNPPPLFIFVDILLHIKQLFKTQLQYE